MSKIAGELNAEMMKKAIHDQRRDLFAEMVRKTGSKQSVLDRLLQEIQFLRDHEGGPMDEEVIDILRGNIDRLARQRDELLEAIEKYIPEADHSSDNGVQFYSELLEVLDRVKESR